MICHLKKKDNLQLNFKIVLTLSKILYRLIQWPGTTKELLMKAFELCLEQHLYCKARKLVHDYILAPIELQKSMHTFL